MKNIEKYKVLHLSHSDNIGGAAISMLRYTQSTSYFTESKILVRIKKSSKKNVVTINNEYLSRYVNFLRIKLGKFISRIISLSTTNTSLNILPSNVSSIINSSECDLVHIHWIGHETISYSDLSQIKKPIVITFHDHLFIRNDFQFYVPGYQNVIKSNYLSSSIRKIIFGYLTNKKKLFFGKKVFITVQTSDIRQLCLKSDNIINSNIYTIPNPIDSDFYYPISKYLAQKMLGIPHNIRYIVFGLYGDYNEPKKGFDILSSAISKIPKKIREELGILIFGSVYPENKINGVPVFSFGFVTDEKILRAIYSSSHVYALPSRYEQFGQTAAEAMLCKLPVVCFSGTGLASLVKHKKSGWISSPFDHKDFADGIEYCLNSDSEMGNIAREDIINSCSYKSVSEKIRNLYYKVLNK